MLRQSPARWLRYWLVVCAMAVSTCLVPLAHADTPVAPVRSFGDVALPSSSYPHAYHTAGTNVYFFAAGDLWKTDGTSAALVKHFPLRYDLTGSYDSDDALVSVGSLVLFTASDGVHGSELWRSDGTTDGTTLVADIQVGPISSGIGDLVVVGNQVVFRANDGVHGTQVWKSDGSAAGTQAVTSGANNLTYATTFTATSGTCFAFVGTNTAGDSELWRSCGDAASTALVADIYAGNTSSSIGNMVYANGAVYFSARDSANGYQVWRSDLTTAGTVRLSTGNGNQGIDPYGITPFGAGVVFGGFTSARGREPWISDGTAAGTKIMADINPGNASSEPRAFTAVGNSGVLFGADDGMNGSELWFSDGTLAGTKLVRDINPGASGSNPSAFVKLPGENRWFFAADDGTHGKELWQTTLAAGSTALVQDLLPGAGSGLGAGYYSLLENNGVTALNQTLLFTADNGTVGDELFSATKDGAKLLRDIVPGRGGLSYNPIGSVGAQFFFSASPKDPTLFYAPAPAQTLWRSAGNAASTTALRSYPSQDDYYPLTSGAITIGDKLYFAAYTAENGEELWVSDGTAAGTKLVADLNPGPNGSGPDDLVNVGGALYFSAYTEATKFKLWRLDANGAPQTVGGFGAATESAYADNLVVAGGTLLFTGSTTATGDELWRVAADGTAQLVKDFCPGTCDGIFSYLQLVVAGGVPYVTAYDGTSAIGLWRVQADGTPVLLKDAPISSTSTEFRIFDWNGALGFFRNETELWRSNGTPSGTAQVAPVSSLLTEFTVSGNKLFWSTGSALNASDGTAAGTATLLNNPFPGASSGDISQLTAAGNRLVFTATTPTAGNELWASDGTASGTQPLELVPGAMGALPLNLASLLPGGKALFSAETPDAGRELWATDGTAAGTTRLSDIAPGAASSDPRDVALAGNLLFFQARDGEGTAGLYSVSRGAILPYQISMPSVRKAGT